MEGGTRRGQSGDRSASRLEPRLQQLAHRPEHCHGGLDAAVAVLLVEDLEAEAHPGLCGQKERIKNTVWSDHCLLQGHSKVTG